MIRLFTYRLPFHTPFRAAGTSWDHREGLLLEWNGSESGWVSEAAPLPGRSRESLPDVIDLAIRHRQKMDEWIRRDSHTPDHLPPSLRFALSALRFQYREGKDGRSDRSDMDTSRAAGPSLQTPLRMNGVIGLDSPDRLETALQRLLRDGYTTLKVKLDASPKPTLRMLNVLSGAHPRLQLRIDANQAWNSDEAGRWLHELESLPVEYCEEPLRNPTLDTLARLQETTTVPLALDESLSHPSDLHKATGHPTLSTYILKATLLGDLHDIHQAIHSSTHPVRTIWSSSLESAVGRTTLRRAAWCWGEPNQAHGLDTATLFRDDLLQDNADAPDQGPLRPSSMCQTWAVPAARLRRELLQEIP